MKRMDTIIGVVAMLSGLIFVVVGALTHDASLVCIGILCTAAGAFLFGWSAR